MNFKKILLTLVFVLSLLSVSAYAKTMQFTMNDYDAKVDEGEISVHTMEVAPYTVEGRTMVPVRIIGETFGADVQYIHEETKVVITLGDKTISMIIGEAVADVNGETVALDVPSVETNGRTLVPLRFVSETLGFDVKYVAITEQVLITNDPAVVEVNGSKISLADFKATYDTYMLQYGETYSQEQIIEAAKMMMTNYALFESEANKWEIGYPFEYKEEIQTIVSELSATIPATLDAVWANILEIEYRSLDLDNFLSQIYMPDEKEVAAYYTDTFMAAKHILISDKNTASSVLSKIKKGEDFDKLMAEYTEDPGIETNPDGYVFTSGEMVAEFENAVKALKVGKVSDLVESDYGYHIIKRIELPEFESTNYEDVAGAMVKELVATHYDQVINEGEISRDAYTTEQLMELCE